MTVHYIYLIINRVNNKKYVGYTNRKNPNLRWVTHLYTSKTSPKPLYQAMCKYGVEAFDFQLLYCSLNGEHTLNTMENYFIREYESFIDNDGYNLTWGGQSNVGWKPSEDTRKLWSLQRTGLKQSELTRKLKSTTTLKRFIDNPSLRLQYRERAIATGARPPIPTLDSARKSAIARTGGCIHTEERKAELSAMVLNGTHNFCNPELTEKRKATWKTINRGAGSKNGNAAFAIVYDPLGVAIAEGFLHQLCVDNQWPFKTFLAARRHGQPLQRGDWKGWVIKPMDNDRC